MPCYHIGNAIVCGKLGPKCRECGAVSAFLCDYPVGDRTCDCPMCAQHATQIGKNRHYCRVHMAQSGATRELFEGAT